MAGPSRGPDAGPPFLPLAFGLLDAGEVGVEGLVVAVGRDRSRGRGRPGTSRYRRGGRRNRSASEVLDRLEREPRVAGLGARERVNALPGFGWAQPAPRKAADRRKQMPRVTIKARKAKRVW